ncbi:uncharacterized protein LOC122249599 [Penaeus japonicus]|uniref:uncharacterized protein LOC122249599 n=1 Tax=Penaeus japonicus TaxID=27405 RepID=UPI001C70EE70|nr:uncharacterized protein LOC122249599 [Penaeus japonicus]XP_042866539.1 uncharacterized protein LOC122249599 [Penaeus japonicus]
MRGECRLKTQRQRLGEDFFTHLNVSCYCKHGEDVFEDLQSLLSVKCSWLPSEPDMKVNSSAIHVVGCSVKSQTFPTGILQLARRTESLEIVVKDSPKLRLAPLSTTEGTVPKITANFINSNLSGLPEGWVTDGKDVELMTKDCEVPILESRALVGYAEDAQVHATFINTDIFTIRMGAFALPKNSVVRMAEGKVLNWERSGYTGGSELHLVRVRLGKVPSKALDISSLKVFTMSGCNVAAMYDEALTYHGTMNRAEEGAAKAVLASNNFIEANGAALARLCHFQALDFHNNTFVNITDPPLRLYRPGCQPERDWDKAVSNTGLSCTRCEDFSEPDAQSCAIYKSAHCISCAENVDECNVDVLPFLVLNKCPSSHPALVESLQNACDVRAAATAAQARSLDSAAASAAPAALVLVAGLALSVLRGRDAHCG